MLDLPLNIDYTGKTVVITGAGGVLCAEMVKAFAQSGARVAALDLNEDAVRRLAEELKMKALSVPDIGQMCLMQKLLRRFIRVYSQSTARVTSL